MLEITLSRYSDEGPAVTQSFQFENDALQAFITEGRANGDAFQFQNLQALGVAGPIGVLPERPKSAKPEAKAKVNEPVTRKQDVAEQPTARTQQQPVKPSTERK